MRRGAAWGGAVRCQLRTDSCVVFCSLSRPISRDLPLSPRSLGKTVQCVSLFEHLRRVEHLSGPFLVVVPLGTISHWKKEFENWTDFNCLVYHDAVRGKETRRLIRETEFYYGTTKVRPTARCPDRRPPPRPTFAPLFGTALTFSPLPPAFSRSSFRRRSSST